MSHSFGTVQQKTLVAELRGDCGRSSRRSSRSYYNLRVGALLIFSPVRRPQPGDAHVATARYHGRERRALMPHGAQMPFFLRPFGSDDAALELGESDLEPLGVVVAHWVTRHAS